MKQKRNSRQRQMILDAVSKRHDHPTADEIYLDVRAKDEKISRGTVYRNLGVLTENREISNVKLPPADRYDCRIDYHYHLLCTECNKVFDAPHIYHRKLDEKAEEDTGFLIKRHRVVFEGVCPECRKKMPE